MKKVSIQGAIGAFHDLAARQFFDETHDFIPQAQFQNVADSVLDGSVDFGVLAVENTLAGSIHPNLKRIMDQDLYVVGEVVLRIKHFLGVIPGTDLNQLREVRSHQLALEQCRSFFQNHPNIQLVDASNTAVAAREVQEQNNASFGAIASEEAIARYGLEIAAAEIENHRANFTRFLVLHAQPIAIENANKASVQFSVDHKPGRLAALLSQWHSIGLNLSKIESLHIEGEPWCYQFFADLEFSQADQLSQGLQALASHCKSHRCLGAYVKSHQSL